MVGSWHNALLLGLETINQILAAGIAITAFSLLLYALTFNLRDRVARSFAMILLCVVVVFAGEAIGSTVGVDWQIDFWLRFQWIGILFLPPAYLHFSDALLSTTGKPSRGRRRWLVRVTYLFSFIAVLLIPFSDWMGPMVLDSGPAPYLKRTLATEAFTLYYAVAMLLSWFNFIRAYQRTITATGRRRMAYLLIGATAPALGSFPYLMFGSGLVSQFPLVFWALSFLSNLLVGGLVIVMAYAVAFFGVAWPDRVVKSRLFKWLMRGPVTACLVLSLTTLTRRAGAVAGFPYTAMVPIVMVASILLFEYLITLFAPLWERWLFFGKERGDINLLRSLEDRLLTQDDLRQFVENVLAAVCDRLQSSSAFVAALNGAGMEMVVQVGRDRLSEDEDASQEIFHVVSQNIEVDYLFAWNGYYLIPLRELAEEGNEDEHLLGVLGVVKPAGEELDDEQISALITLSQRVALALQDRKLQQKLFLSLHALQPQVELIQRLRAAARYDGSAVLLGDTDLPPGDLVQWVKEALTHYWGGPKLTESPLLQLQVVQGALKEHDGNSANALRAILRQAIEEVKPEGERRFTGEWILYNILEMKFMEGRKVREIAMRLAMSEADLYRKQRVAIEAVTRAIMEMEEQVREEIAHP